jgi:hypothetical protein
MEGHGQYRSHCEPEASLSASAHEWGLAVLQRERSVRALVRQFVDILVPHRDYVSQEMIS